MNIVAGCCIVCVKKRTSKVIDLKIEKSKLEFVYDLLTPKVRVAVQAIPEIERSRVQEIRLRQGRKLTVTAFGKEYFVTPEGRLMSDSSLGIDINAEDIDVTYKRAFRNSLHSYQREIARGYITAEGGNRVGFCGTAVVDPHENYRLDTIKNISSINIRIAREIFGAGQSIYQRAFDKGVSSLIIAGPPSSGKTTVLRDICRLLGNSTRISLIDERNEIAAVKDATAQNSVGMLTDVFNSYNKYEGIMTAVKVMSPTVLVCDEIGSKEDAKALEYALNSGVKLIVTCHAPDFDSLKRRPVVSKLIKDKAFDHAAILGTGSMCGQLQSFYKL